MFWHLVLISLSLLSFTFKGHPGFRGDYRRFNGRNNLKSVPNAHIRSEIKDIEQVRKERQKRADRLFLILRASLRKGRSLVEREKGGKQNKLPLDTGALLAGFEYREFK